MIGNLTFSDIKTVVRANVPYDTGELYSKGVRFGETNRAYSITYDGNSVPHAIYQEYGFTHYLSGKFIDVNAGYIRNDTVNGLDFLINNATSREKNLIMAANKRTTQARENMMSQGLLTSLKGNENRGVNGVPIGR